MAEDVDIKIIAFLCWKWGYGSADMAGTIRAQYPSSIRTVLVPCSGRVGSDVIMRSFGRGADGVMIIGWYPKECDYETGNYFAYREVEYVKEVLRSMGINEKRIYIGWCTAAEGQKFQQNATAFDKVIRELGPSPLRTKDDTKKKAKTWIIKVLSDETELKKWEFSWRNGMHHTTHRFYITLKYKILKYKNKK